MPPKAKSKGKKATVLEEVHLEALEKERAKLQEKHNELVDMQRARAELKAACSGLEAAAAEARKVEERRVADERRRDRERAESRFRKEAERRREARADSLRLADQHALVVRQENALRRAETEVHRLADAVHRLEGDSQLREREALNEVVSRLHGELRALRVREMAVGCRQAELDGLLSACTWSVKTPRRAVVVSAAMYEVPGCPSNSQSAANATDVPDILRRCGFSVDVLQADPECVEGMAVPADGADAVKVATPSTKAGILRALEAVGTRGEEQLLVWLNLHAILSDRHGLLLMPCDASLPDGYKAGRRGDGPQAVQVLPEHQLLSLGEIHSVIAAHSSLRRVAVVVDGTAPRLHATRPQGGVVAVLGTGLEPVVGEYLLPATTPLRAVRSSAAVRQPAGLLCAALRQAVLGSDGAEGLTAADFAANVRSRPKRSGCVPRWPLDTSLSADPSVLMPQRDAWPATSPHPTCAFGDADAEPVSLLAPAAAPREQPGGSLMQIPQALLLNAAGDRADELSNSFVGKADYGALVTVLLACELEFAPMVAGVPEAVGRVPAALRRARTTLRDWAQSYFGEVARAWVTPERRHVAAAPVLFIHGGGPSVSALNGRLGPLSRVPTAHAAGAVEITLLPEAGGDVRLGPLSAADVAGMLPAREERGQPRYLCWGYAEQRVEGCVTVVLVYTPRGTPWKGLLPSDAARALRCPAAEDGLPAAPTAADGVVSLPASPVEELVKADVTNTHPTVTLAGVRCTICAAHVGTEITLGVPAEVVDVLDVASRASGGKVAPAAPPTPPAPPPVTVHRLFSTYCSRRRARGMLPPAREVAALPPPPPAPPSAPFRVLLSLEGSPQSPAHLGGCPAVPDEPTIAPDAVGPLRFDVPSLSLQSDGVLATADVWDADGARVGSAQGLLAVADPPEQPLPPKQQRLLLTAHGADRTGALHVRWSASSVDCAQHCTAVYVECSGVAPPPLPRPPPPPPPPPLYCARQPVELARAGGWVPAVITGFDPLRRTYSVRVHEDDGSEAEALPVVSERDLRSGGEAGEWVLWEGLQRDDPERKGAEAEAAEAAAAEAAAAEHAPCAHEVELRGVRPEQWLVSLNSAPLLDVRRAVQSASELVVVFGFPSQPAEGAVAAARLLAKAYILEARYRSLIGRSPAAFLTYASQLSSAGSYPAGDPAPKPPAPAAAVLLGPGYADVERHLATARTPSVVVCDVLSARHYVLHAGAAAFRNGGHVPTSTVRQLIDAVRQGDYAELGTHGFTPPPHLSAAAVGLL